MMSINNYSTNMAKMDWSIGPTGFYSNNNCLRITKRDMAKQFHAQMTNLVKSMINTGIRSILIKKESQLRICSQCTWAIWNTIQKPNSRKRRRIRRKREFLMMSMKCLSLWLKRNFNKPLRYLVMRSSRTFLKMTSKIWNKFKKNLLKISRDLIAITMVFWTKLSGFNSPWKTSTTTEQDMAKLSITHTKS